MSNAKTAKPGHDAKPDDAPKPRFARLKALGRRAIEIARRRPRVTAVVGVAVALVVLPALIVLVAMPAHPEPGPVELTVDMALDAFDRGEFLHAAKIANSLESSDSLSISEAGAPSFVLGAIASHNADELLGQDQLKYREYAAKKLAQSHEIGFPASHRAAGEFLLGKNLFLTGRLADSVTILEGAMKRNPDRAVEIHRYLATALLLEATPESLRGALDHVAQVLADETLSEEIRDEIELQAAETQLRLNDIDACEILLEDIPSDSPLAPSAELLRGRILVARALALAPGATEIHQARNKAADELVAKAETTFRQVAKMPTEGVEVRPSATYMLGRCLLHRGDVEAAIETFAQVHERYGESPEAFAAALDAADALRRRRRDEEASQALAGALALVEDWHRFANPWVSIDDAKRRLYEAYDDFVQRRAYEEAVAAAAGFEKLGASERGVEMAAQVHARWGDELLAKAEQADLKSRLQGIERGRELLRQAGDEYRELAELRILSSHFVDDLLNAAEAYRRGHGFARAVEVYREYLDSEPRKQRPQALAGYGEALLAVGKYNKALAALGECVAYFPNSETVYRARLLAAQAYIERGNVDRAIEVLLENLTSDVLRPVAEEYRESLAAISRALYDAGRFAEAASYLEQAAERYPNRAEGIEANYLAAESYSRLARAALAADGAVATADSREERTLLAQRHFSAALEHYNSVLRQLLQRLESDELTEQEDLLLRNCYFGRGAALMGLEQYEEAIVGYGAALGRYQDAPESLEAFVQIAECYRRLGQPAEARRQVDRARSALRRFNANDDFLRTTSFSHAEWSQRLDMLSKL